MEYKLYSKDIVQYKSNADFDGDVLNQLALELPELNEIFADFSPQNMLINRVNNQIRYNCSALENVTLAILSDN